MSKDSPAAVLVDSSGNFIGVAGNPVKTDPTGTTSQPITAAALPLPSGAATAAKQPALGTAGTPSTDVLSMQGVAGGTALPISAAALPLPSGAATAAKQPALGTAGTPASDVISVQGVSGGVAQPISAAALPLPSGAATETTLGSAKTDLDNIYTRQGDGNQKTQVTSLPAIPTGSNTIGKVDQGAAGAAAWKVDGSAVTQPISAAALPLPSGAATAAKQPALGTAGTPSSDVLTVQGATSMTPLKVDGSGVTQPVSGSVTANIGTSGSLALDATLTGGTQKAIARGGAKGATTAADVTSTAEGSDHQALDVQIMSGGVAKDPTQVRALTSSDVVTAAQGTAAAASAAWPTKVTDGTNVAAVKAASTAPVVGDPALVVAISPNTPAVPVSAAALPLPSGAATSAKQDTGNTSLGNIDTKTPALGQAAMAASVPVAIANNQSAVPISATALPLPSGASTAAKQPAIGTVGTPSSDVLTIQGIAGGTAVPCSHSSLPLPTGAATEATLAAESAKLPASLGQKTMAGSLAVTMASDQAVPIMGTGHGNWIPALPEGFNNIAAGDQAPLSLAPDGNLHCYSQVLTDAGSFRDDFLYLTNSLTGTVTFTNGSTAITGSGCSFTTQVNRFSYIKLSSHADSVYALVLNVIDDNHLVLDTAYSGANGSGTATQTRWLPVIGTGGSASVANSILTVTGGTTAGQNTYLTHGGDYAPLEKIIRFQVSQRIANETIKLGLYDNELSPNYQASIELTGTDNTKITLCSRSSANAADLETYTITLPFGLTTAAYINIVIAFHATQVRFFYDPLDGSPRVFLGACRTHLPDPYQPLLGCVGIFHTGGAVTSTSLQIDFTALLDYNIVNVEGEEEGGNPAAACTNVAAAVADTVLLAANNSRDGATFFNDSTSVLYLKWGTGASATSFTVRLTAGGYYELPLLGNGKPYRGAINGYWASANGACRVTEAA